MVDLSEVRVAVVGATGPAVMTMYCQDAAAFMPLLAYELNTLSHHFPTGISYEYPVAGNTIDPLTGTVTGAWGPIAAITATVGDADGGYSMVSGACIRWHTGLIVRGHRVVGKNFLVPLGAGCYDNTGTILDTRLTEIRAAASALSILPGGNLVVWSRPVYATGPPRTLVHDGNYGPVLSATVADKAAILRSRRD